MNKSQLFIYAILWHPTEKQVKDDSAKSKLIVEPTNIMALDVSAAQMMAAMAIPGAYKEQIDQIQIALRPF